jgi:BTB/POZ domain-containing protein KCTD9
LYRGTRDGFGAQDFHSKCDNKSPTLSICKTHDSSYIFGGFTTVSWESPTVAKLDPNAFLFSLTNKDNKPVKMKVDPNKRQYAIRCHSGYGPIFGFGGDIHIDNNANTTMDSFSNLGWTYKHPQYRFGTNEAKTFLAGSCQFQLDEIEVYEKE